LQKQQKVGSSTGIWFFNLDCLFVRGMLCQLMVILIGNFNKGSHVNEVLEASQILN